MRKGSEGVGGDAKAGGDVRAAAEWVGASGAFVDEAFEKAPESAIAKAMVAYDNFARHLIMSHREDLTKTQADVMLGLFVFGGMNMSQMSEHLAVSREQTSRAVGPLVERGMVERARNPNQRRQVEIFLSEAGCRDVVRRNALVLEDIRACVAGLSDEDRLALVEASRVAEGVMRKLWDAERRAAAAPAPARRALRPPLDQ